MATDTRDAAPETQAGGRGARTGKGTSRPGYLKPVQYYREVIAELRKVIYPGRSELVTYVTVVLVFVIVMTAIVASMDYGLTKLVLTVFG